MNANDPLNAVDPLDEARHQLISRYLPVEEQSFKALRELMLYASWLSEPEQADRYSNIAKQEVIKRKALIASGPVFDQGDIVEVVLDIRWWPKVTAHKPPVGIRGEVLRPSVPEIDRFYPRSEPEDFDGLVPVSFRADQLGYGWTEGDDSDREYVTYNMPNYALQKISV